MLGGGVCGLSAIDGGMFPIIGSPHSSTGASTTGAVGVG